MANEQGPNKQEGPNTEVSSESVTNEQGPNKQEGPSESVSSELVTSEAKPNEKVNNESVSNGTQPSKEESKPKPNKEESNGTEPNKEESNGTEPNVESDEALAAEENEKLFTKERYTKIFNEFENENKNIKKENEEGKISALSGQDRTFVETPEFEDPIEFRKLKYEFPKIYQNMIEAIYSDYQSISGYAEIYSKKWKFINLMKKNIK